MNMRTKLIIAYCLACIIISNARSQSDDISDFLPLNVWVFPTNAELPGNIAQRLESKLLQIATANGISGINTNLRFILTANVDLYEKSILATAPPKHAYTLDMTFYVADGINGDVFSSYSRKVNGVGNSPEQAYLNAFNSVRPNDNAFKSLIEVARQKIANYYDDQCQFIIQAAQRLAKMSQFDEALWELLLIPTASPDCWNLAKDHIETIYQKKIDYECNNKLLQASNVWFSNQNWSGAELAGKILMTIDPNSSCIAEMNELVKHITNRVLELDNREWNFHYDYEIGLHRDMINAAREVGVAWGKNQPQHVVYKSLW